ncbi:MAG: hypothetical protein AAFV19_17515 [Pseudomonadota bacterium]
MPDVLASSRLPAHAPQAGAHRSDLTTFLERLGGPIFRTATAEAKLDMAWGLLRLSDAELAVKGLTRAQIFEHVYEDRASGVRAGSSH